MNKKELIIMFVSTIVIGFVLMAVSTLVETDAVQFLLCAGGVGCVLGGVYSVVSTLFPSKSILGSNFAVRI